ncbi:hypothetical protein CFP56_022824, partial [Quercus suber]
MQTLFKCNRTLDIIFAPRSFKNMSCGDYNIYYTHSNHRTPSSFSQCSIIHLPKNEHTNKYELFSLLSAEFNLEVQVSDACCSCHGTGGQCHQDEKEKFCCANTEKGIDSTDNRRSGCQVILSMFFFIVSLMSPQENAILLRLKSLSIDSLSYSH